MIGKQFQKLTIVSYEDFMERVEKNSFYNKEKIKLAFDFASKAHDGQTRRSGVPFITHPLYVACILVDLGMDTDSICAALLHDVVEDTSVELPEIKKLFGDTVALLIDGVTKIGKIPVLSEEEAQAENIRKMLLAMAKDIRVVIIKLADRLHNLRTLQFMPPQKRLDKALETMEIYAPLAHRLGIKTIKDEMEDISIRYLDPIGYKEIQNSLAMKRKDRDKFVMVIKEEIKRRVQKFIPNVYVMGRVKSINGIYRKMFFQNNSIEQIYDIYAVRIIVNNLNDCYNVLGIIHDMYTPLPKFTDYISTPKANMYQSLHTTVLGKEHIPFEVQIRTWEMHRTAEYGIAAHWKYKTGVTKSDIFEKRLSWIKTILESQDKTDVTGFINAIKTDLSSDEVIVLTPAGDVITLPKGSTPIDFAYSLHSAVGNSMIGAKLDGKIVPISTKLSNGQIVQILTSKDKNHGPSRDWINIVKTNQAKNKIRQWFKKKYFDENVIIGKSTLELEFRKSGIRLDGEELKKFLATLCKRQHCKTMEDFYSAIGYGGIILSRLMPRIRDDYLKFKKPEQPKATVSINPIPPKVTNGVLIEGIDDCVVRFAKCCNPLPGDKIIGFITRGNGVSIHNCECRNVPKNFDEVEDKKRWIKARWDKNIKGQLDSTLEIQVTNRKGMLADITQAVTNMHLFINSLNTRNSKDGNAIIYVTITVNSLEHLRAVSGRLKSIKGVTAINRL